VCVCVILLHVPRRITPYLHRLNSRDCVVLHGMTPISTTWSSFSLTLFLYHSYTHSPSLTISLTFSQPHPDPITHTLLPSLSLSLLSPSPWSTHTHALSLCLLKMNDKDWESECLRAQAEAARYSSSLDTARSEIMYVHTTCHQTGLITHHQTLKLYTSHFDSLQRLEEIESRAVRASRRLYSTA
jgi:hypothetical protein